MSEAKVDSLEFMETVLDNINSKLSEIIISDEKERVKKLVELLHETTRKWRQVIDVKYNIGEEQREEAKEEAKAMGKALDRMLGM